MQQKMKQTLAMNQSITWLWERGVASGQQELMFEFRFKCEFLKSETQNGKQNKNKNRWVHKLSESTTEPQQYNLEIKITVNVNRKYIMVDQVTNMGNEK